MNAQEDDEELSEDITPKDPEMETNNQVFAQISQTEKSLLQTRQLLKVLQIPAIQ